MSDSEEYMGIKVDYSRDKLFDELGLKRLRESYMREDETSPQQRYAYVSTAFASNMEHAQRLYNYASKHWLSYSTPILAYGRSKKGLPISCFGAYVEDTVEGLIDTQSEVNWLSVMGGGVSVGFGIRSFSEKSTGLMSHIKTYDANSLAYRQSSTRRGSYAMYVDISHPDILIFLEMRKPTGDHNLRAHNLHHGINITDAFMERVTECMLDPEADDSWDLIDPNTKAVKETVSVKELWQRILTMRIETGEPYLHFIDTANRALPQFQKDLGLKINSSNLCVSGDTPILTSKGYFPIKALVDQEVEVWNGEEWSKTTIRQTSESSPLLEVKISNGVVLKTTPDHKFYVVPDHKKPAVEVKARDLVTGMELVETKFPVIHGEQGESVSSTEAYAIGLSTFPDTTQFVPINYDFDYKYNWMLGLFAAHGTTYDGDYAIKGNFSYEFLNDVRRLLSTCSIGAVVVEEKGKWILRWAIGKNNYNVRETVVSVRPIEAEPTYCFTEPLRHMGVFDGILTGQCSEIELANGPDRTFVCCLSSLNVAYYDDWKDDPQFISDVVEMLDNVIERFIHDAPDTIERARYSAMRERAIGIGVLGFHTYLQEHMIPFEGVMAKSFNMKLFNHIQTQAMAANLRLGYERGEAPDCEGTGRRHSHVMAVAPTASTSIIMGNISPSIEPYRANAFRQNTLSGAFLMKNHCLDNLIKKKIAVDPSIDYDEVWSDIIADDGSIQRIDIFSDLEKDVFKTAMEIDQRWVVSHAADRAPMIDQGQSVNLFFLPDANVAYVHAVHYQAWKSGLKALYYCRSDSVGKVDKLAKKIKREIIESIDMKALAEGEECLACGS